MSNLIAGIAVVLGVAALAEGGQLPVKFEMPFTARTKEEAVEWQKRARARLLELVEREAPRVPTDEVPLDVRSGEPKDMGDYTLYEQRFRGSNRTGAHYPFRLAIPKGKGPFPAMLCLHGHSGSFAPLFDPKSPYKALADRFARGGYVVLAPSFGHHKYAAMALWDLMRCLDILEERPEVDAKRIGVAGLSMGGEWTMWLAACDERPRVAVVSGWMCTTEGIFSVHNCPCWRLPGFEELMDVSEVHILIAPRPLLFESAERDNCFPIRYAREGFARIRAGYKLWGAEESVKQDIWPAGHEWHGAVAYGFVDKVLGGQAAKSAP